MQTTLLGLAIAFILALVAALIGPHFVDWNQFRSRFEAEATRIVGAPVRFGGMLDARILPTPTLRLREISVGDPATTRKLSAEKLDVELSLGSLLRGELRASELSLDGFAVDFDLDRQGQIQGPLGAGAFNLGSLAIDRLNLAGRMTLHDVASSRAFELSGLKFGGDVRASAGTMRGEGSFVWSDQRSSFRISTGQSADGKGTRFRLILNPASHSAIADLDGVVFLESQTPKFDGSLTLASTSDPKSSREPQDAVPLPWRVVSRVQGNPLSATFEKIELVYGAEDIALRLSGAGGITFGADPALRVKLAAKQLDADRLRATKSVERKSNALIPELQKMLSSLPRPSVPIHIELTADQIAFGGRPVQNIALQLAASKNRWVLDKLSLRAPGATEITVSGAMSSNGAAPEFSGPLRIEAGEPETFLAWLQGRSDSAPINHRAMRLRSHMSLQSQRMVFGDLDVETGGGKFTGDVSIQNRDGAIDRIDAILNADEFMIDSLSGSGASLTSLSTLPTEAHVSLDIARPFFQNRALGPMAVSASYNPNELAVDRFSIKEASGLSLSGRGSLNLKSSEGQFSMMATAPSLEKVSALVAPFSSDFAGRLKLIGASKPDGARLKFDAKIEKSGAPARAALRATVDIHAAPIKGSAVVAVVPRAAFTRWADVDTLRQSDFKVETMWESDYADPLLKITGLDRIFSVSGGSMTLGSSVEGSWRAPLKLSANVKGRETDASMDGIVDPWSTEAKADLKISIDRADISPFFNLRSGSVPPIKATSRLGIFGDVYKLQNVDARIGHSTMRGEFAASRGEVKGEANFDSIGASDLLAWGIGATGKDSTAPLEQNVAHGLRGSISLRSAQVRHPRMASLEAFSGTLRSDGQSLTLDNGTGQFAGGAATLNGDVRKLPNGTSANLQVKIEGADASAIRPLNLSLPEAKASLEVSLASQGRSADALLGAMSGVGTVTFKDVRIPNLSPRAFEDAVTASDDGRQTDDAALKLIVENGLQESVTQISGAQISFSIQEGRLRVPRAMAETKGASVLVSGGYDFTADQMDIRASLLANVVNPATGRPEIRIDLNGSPGNVARTLDVSSLSTWLAMRSIDRQTRKLDQLERGVTPGLEPLAETMSLEVDLPKTDPLPLSEVKLPVRDPRRRSMISQEKVQQPASRDVSSEFSAPLVQPLPPAIHVTPAPGAVRPPKPRPPMVLTPPATGTTIF